MNRTQTIIIRSTRISMHSESQALRLSKLSRLKSLSTLRCSNSGPAIVIAKMFVFFVFLFIDKKTFMLTLRDEWTFASGWKLELGGVVDDSLFLYRRHTTTIRVWWLPFVPVHRLAMHTSKCLSHSGVPFHALHMHYIIVPRVSYNIYIYIYITYALEYCTSTRRPATHIQFQWFSQIWKCLDVTHKLAS